MDTDLLKPTPADQIEMMLMMQNMDKSITDLVGGEGGPYIDSSPMMSFSCNSHHHHHPAAATMQQLYDTQGHMPTISFSNNTQNPLILPHSFGGGNGNGNENDLSSPSSIQKQTSMAAIREMIFRIAAMQPIYIDPESVKPPKRRSVRISKDPQSVAARHRRERISERIRILQRLVPGGTKMDTASMLDEAIHYVKFLKTQVQSLERAAINNHRTPPFPVGFPVGFPVAMSSGTGYFSMTAGKANGYNCLGGQTVSAPQN